MISHPTVVQGTAEWIALRLGKPTASEFDKIITPKKMELSAQARPYALRLAAERLLLESLTPFETTEWMQRGTELEPQARRAYAFDRDIEVRQVGFVTTDDGRIGCSPDGLVGDDGLLEIKCPSPHVHLGYMLDGFGLDYHVQRQGQLWVAERDWVDIMSFSDKMPPWIVRYDRDDLFISKLARAVKEFANMVDEIVEEAKARGVFQTRPIVATPTEQMAEEQDRPSAAADVLPPVDESGGMEV